MQNIMSFFAPESWLASKYIEKKIVGQPGLTYVPSRKEKVHSTTLKYRCYLSLDPQPQNQLLRIPEEFNPPPSGLMGCFGLPWRHITPAYVDSAPHQQEGYKLLTMT
jgi:hypothetical protein